MAPSSDFPLPLQIRIASTEERSSMLKSWSVYLLEVDDFGRKSTLEKRFDDFDRLHSDMKEVDPGLPPLPEKKFMASTDASVVAERKPAFEKILRYLLRSDLAVHEKGQTIFKFLELSAAAVVAFRYLFKSQRLSFARQCGKLTDPKHEKEAYRLTHPAVVRMSLRLLEEGALKEPGAEEAVVAEAEVAVVEMLRFALANGQEPTRRFFLQEDGLGLLLRFIFRKGKKDPKAGPDQRARGVLNALIKVEGERFPQLMADFLQRGGVTVLQEGIELFQSPGFGDFISKLMWLAWDVQVQQVFFAEAHRPEALGLLSQLFVCPSRSARVCAGLLLASALSHAQLGHDRQQQAAEGLSQLTEEMVSCGDCQEDDDVEIRSFVQGLGQSADRFARILTCAQAPWQHGQLASEADPLWSGATFSLWCLLRMRPDAARLKDLRAALPTVAAAGPPRARWLAGELMLHLQLQAPNSPEAIVEQCIQEKAALETSLQEMFQHTRQALHQRLEEGNEVMATQQSLVELRQKPLRLQPSGVSANGWHQDLEAALSKLLSLRHRLSDVLSAAERQKGLADDALRHVMDDLDLPEEPQMDQQLQSMRHIEAEFLARRAEQEDQSTDLKAHEDQVALANASMERTDKALQEMRGKVNEYEVDISHREREVQSKRTMASSDLQAARNQLSSELDTIKQKQTKLRERALQLQSEESDGKEMERLKAEAGRLKARATEVTQELQAASVDPQQLEQQAACAERAVQHLVEQRDSLREQLPSLEEEHLQARSEWQQAVSRLQYARQEKEVADLQGSGLRRQLEAEWASWQPLWSKRLQAWRSRCQSLAQASKASAQLQEARQRTWDALQCEAEARHETFFLAQELQQQLAALAQDLSSIEDDCLQAEIH